MENIDKFVEESIPLREDYRPTYSLGGGVYDLGDHEHKFEWCDKFSGKGDGSGEGDGSSDTIDNDCYTKF